MEPVTYLARWRTRTKKLKKRHVARWGGGGGGPRMSYH